MANEFDAEENRVKLLKGAVAVMDNIPHLKPVHFERLSTVSNNGLAAIIQADLLARQSRSRVGSTLQDKGK